MSLQLPADVSNIIFDYYAQLRDLKWCPFIDGKTGKLIWKVNKYSAKYDNIHKTLKYRKDNLRENITVYIEIMKNNEIINSFCTPGTCVTFRTAYIIKNYDTYAQVLRSSNRSYIQYSYPCNSVHSLFYSSGVRSFGIDIYQDGNIYANLIEITQFIENEYLLVFETY